MPIDDEDLERLYHEVFGNGKVGMDEQVRANTGAIAAIRADFGKLNGKLDTVKSSVDELVRDRRDERARREGSKATLNWLKWGLSLLLAIVLIGGSLGLWRTNQQWQEVQQQLQRIPALPE